MERIIGKTPVKIDVDKVPDEICMLFSDGTSCKWFHYQDCCESVVIDDISGDFNDLIGHPLLVADERVSSGDESKWGTSTWTFYTFRNIGGSVDVKWHGSSNGYYSESVDFEFTDAKN